nr:ankyrin repeat domain-containing protein [Armatimonas sp.]
MTLVVDWQKGADAEKEEHTVTFDVSPDGRQIAFSATDGDLYLLDLKTHQVTRLTRTGQCASPAFSPEGTKIVYCACASGETGSALYELTLANKTTRRLTNEAKASDSQPSYSPDGTRITFTRTFRYRRYSMGGMIWSDYDIHVMRADGTELKRLTTKKYYSAGRPKFSRDGKDIVFAADLPYDRDGLGKKSGSSMITILQVSASVGGEPRILLPLPKPGKRSRALGSEPDFSPNGRDIAFISDRTTPFSYDICIMDRDGSNLRSLHITKVSTYNQQPTYLPDGKSLLFLAGTDFSLWQVNTDGSNAHLVSDASLFLNPSVWKPRAPEPTNLKSVHAVLAKGTSPGTRDALGRSMLSNAASRGDIESVRFLLQKGANPNTPDADGSTVLGRAIEEDHLDVVRLLIAKGAKVNAAPQGGEMKGIPPLVFAALGRNVQIVELLIRAGADVKATDPLGNTALHWACNTGNVALARLLLAKGSPVDSRDAMGMTPLMGAVGAGKPELVKLLIAKGANVRARDDRTRQLYGMAQFTGDKEGAEKIRKSGKLDKLHEDGRSVLDWARIGGNPAVIALVKKAGATQ